MNRAFTITLTNPTGGTVYTIDETSYTNGIGISEASMKLDEILCDSELEIGACNANKFEVQIYGLTEDVTGFDIVVSVTDSGTSKLVFTGKVESSETDKFDRYRTIVAYDAMYWLRDLDVGDWWKTYWSGRTTAKLGSIRNALCQEFANLTVYNGSLGQHYNDNVYFYAQDSGTRSSNWARFMTDDSPRKIIKTSVPEYFMSRIADSSESTDPVRYPAPKTLQIKFGVLLRMICELQMCCPNIRRDGKIEFITIGETGSTYDVDEDYDTNQSEFQDYTTENPTGFSVYDTSDELAQIVPGLATQNTNPYPISGNIFLLSMSASQIRSILTPLIPVIQSVSYKPATLNMIVSALDIHLGDKISSIHKQQRCEHLVLAQSLSGSLLVDQEISSPAYGKELNNKSTSVSDTVASGLKFSQIIHDIDGITLRVGKVVNDAGDINAAEIVLSINEDDTSNIRIDADKIQLSGTVTLSQIGQKSSGDPTIIDGGYIKTNTITADKIDVTNLVAENLLVKDSNNRIVLKAYADEPDNVIIGGFHVDNKKLYSGGTNGVRTVVMQTSDSGTTYAFAAGGTTNDNYSDCPFRVTHTGELYADSAHISGEITATSGSIGGCTIENGTLKVQNANIQNLDVSKLNGGTCNSAVNFTNAGVTGQIKNGTTLGTNGNCVVNTFEDDPFYGLAIELNNATWIRLYANTIDEATHIAMHTNNHIDINAPVLLLYCTNGYLYGTWHSDSSIVVTSDINKKTDIQPFTDNYNLFYDDLQPISFRYIDGTSNRRHTGFIAQHIKQSLEKCKISTKDFAGFVEYKDDVGDTVMGLRYEEFIALNTWQIQQLKTRVAELEKQLAAKKK